MPDINQIVSEKYCLSCKGCCRFEGPRSAWAVHLAAGEQQALGIQDTVLPLSEPHADGTCACSFFDTQANRCTIYYKRPFECRLYPFLINRQGSFVFLALDMRCPYVAENYQTPRMRDHIAYLAGVCNSPALVRQLRENPWLIQQYPDVLNVAPISI